jgi:hypothetical protein
MGSRRGFFFDPANFAQSRRWVSKSRGTLGSVLWFSFCRKGVSLISNILSAREVYDEEQFE